MTTPMSAIATIAAVTLRRARRSRTLWLGLGFASLTILVAILQKSFDRMHVADPAAIFAVEVLVLMIVPPMLVAASVGEDIEDRTNTYLWSRPIPRWTVLVGKLVALAPVAIMLLVATWAIAVQLGTNEATTGRQLAGVAAGAAAVSAMSAGLATLVPKHGMAISVVYMLLVDIPIGAIPASLQKISITYNARIITGIEQSSHDPSMVVAGLTLVALSAVWLAVGMWRFRRLES